MEKISILDALKSLMFLVFLLFCFYSIIAVASYYQVAMGHDGMYYSEFWHGPLKWLIQHIVGGDG